MVNLAQIEASAITPDQLVTYVKSVSGMQNRTLHNSIIYTLDDSAVLVCFPTAMNAFDASKLDLFQKELDSAVKEALAIPGIKYLTTLAPLSPSVATAEAKVHKDIYW